MGMFVLPTRCLSLLLRMITIGAVKYKTKEALSVSIGKLVIVCLRHANGEFLRFLVPGIYSSQVEAETVRPVCLVIKASVRAQASSAASGL